MRRLGFFLFLPALLLFVLFLPLTPRGLGSHPHPVRNYAEAIDSVASFARADSAGIAPECRSALYTHGRRTAHVVLIFHGLTNCPAQFDSLARIAYARGANVFVPRLPRHGFANRMTDELGKSDARELVAFADRAVDAASGPSDTLTVVGLSVGGTLAAWAAQERGRRPRGADRAHDRRGEGAGRAHAGGHAADVAAAEPVRLVGRQGEGAAEGAAPRLPRASPRARSRPRCSSAARPCSRRARAAGRRAAALVTIEGDQAVDNELALELARWWERSVQ
jgi:pimeloyl-ACP methyl ester carboxylesterase